MCVCVALVIYLSSVAWLSVQCFPTLSHKRYDFRRGEKGGRGGGEGGVTKHKMCVLILPTTFMWNISRSKKN